jgi:hypothetical protein
MKKKQDTAYKDIVAALEEVNSSRTFRNIGKPERGDLDKAVLILEELSWEIVSEDIADFSERISAAAKDLAALGAKIRRDYDHLKRVADCLKKAAKAAGLAAGIAGKMFSG